MKRAIYEGRTEPAPSQPSSTPPKTYQERCEANFEVLRKSMRRPISSETDRVLRAQEEAERAGREYDVRIAGFVPLDIEGQEPTIIYKA